MSGSKAGRWDRVAVAALLVTTLALGAFLRWQLAGTLSHVGTFAHLRHAHSHLGYYGVLFPLLWMGWRASGGRGLARPLLFVYLAAAVVSALGFAWRGYFVVSIVGSSLVGLGWLLAAWSNRAWLRAPSTWRFPGPTAVVIAAAFVPPIAVFTRRDPVFAQELVRTFLGVLVFGVFLPGALDRLRSRPPPGPAGGPLWLGCALAGAVWLGVGVHPLLSVGLLACGAWTAVATARAPAPLWLRGLWQALGLGAMGLASGLVPKTEPVTIAALHFAFLGPLLVTWVRDAAGGVSGRLAVVWLVPVVTLSAAVAFPQPLVAAWAGVAVVSAAGIGAWALGRGPGSASSDSGLSSPGTHGRE